MSRQWMPNFARIQHRIIAIRNPFVAALVLLCLPPLTAIGADNLREFNRRVYIGAEIGQSTLHPDLDASNFRLEDRRDMSSSIHIGYDLSKRWTIEAYYSDLGAAKINPVRNPQSTASLLSYQQYGISALTYLFNSRDEYDYSDMDASPDEGLYRREGLSVFTRLGVSNLTSENNTDRLKESHVEPHLGAGLEYEWGAGFSTRAEIISYNKEALQMSVGLIKRFGRATSSVTIENDVRPTPPARIQRVALTPPYKPDIQRVQLPPPKAPGIKHTNNRRSPVLIALPYLFFTPSQSGLSSDEKSKLDQLVHSMNSYPRLRLRVSGFPDARSTSKARLNLAFARAANTKKYLKSKGIATHRVSIEGIDMASANHAADRGVEFSIIPNRRE